MPAPSKLLIAIDSLNRLLKEEASYHKEQAQQEARIESLEKTASGENAEFQMKQERKALEETKAVFKPLRKRIDTAVEQLEQRLSSDESSAPPEDVEKALDALNAAKASSSSE